ncbi:MAG: hypothetical protein Q7R30_03105 [Acidobacteriota bacterium]|nr:hypothetical protein [Acidobacteriota bacterium]
MSFLKRVVVIIGLSLVMTLLLMVIHWEPERPVAPAAAETTGPAPAAAGPEPLLVRAADVRHATDASSHDNDGVGWVMEDVQNIEGLSMEIRAALAGCAVPRSPDLPNIISGKFRQAGESRGPQRGSRAGVEADLAVLCVRGPYAAVYVFWAGHAADAEIATEVEFIAGRSIRAARAADIRVEVTRDLPIEPGMPLTIRHDGIQLGGGCCATTYYWHRGRWRSYDSAD